MTISIFSAACGAVLGVALGCAAAPAPGAAPQSACATEAATMRVTLGGSAPTDAAGTVRTAACRLTGDALARARSATSAVLRVEGVRPPSAPMTVLVFLDDAEPGASTDRPSFAGSFTLLAGGGRAVNAQVALGPALAAALRGRDDVSVTLVPVDRAGHPLAGELSFERLVLDLR